MPDIINEFDENITPPTELRHTQADNESKTNSHTAAIVGSDFDADDILSALYELNEENHFPGTIVCTLEKLHNITPDKQLEDVPEEDHEFIDSLEVEQCKVDFFSLDGETANLVFEFDGSRSVFLRELNDFFNRYRIVQEELASNEDAKKDVVPILTVTIMPEKFMGLGALIAVFPTTYLRTLNDNGINASFHTMFKMDSIRFQRLEVSEEENIDIEAEALKEQEDDADSIYQ